MIQLQNHISRANPAEGNIAVSQKYCYEISIFRVAEQPEQTLRSRDPQLSSEYFRNARCRRRRAVRLRPTITHHPLSMDSASVGFFHHIKFGISEPLIYELL